jgi:hypothetical protein
MYTEETEEKTSLLTSNNGWEHRVCTAMMAQIPSVFDKNSPLWLPFILPYIISVAFVDFNTWGLLSSLVPFSFAETSKFGGSLYLAIAYEAGAVALVLGDLSTIYIKIPFYLAIPLFAMCAGLLYLAAGGVFSQTAAPGMVFVFCICRFLEAHIITTVYRVIASQIKPEYKETAARTLGVVDQIIQTCGTILSVSLVSQYGNC